MYAPPLPTKLQNPRNGPGRCGQHRSPSTCSFSVKVAKSDEKFATLLAVSGSLEREEVWRYWGPHSRGETNGYIAPAVLGPPEWEGVGQPLGQRHSGAVRPESLPAHAQWARTSNTACNLGLLTGAWERCTVCVPGTPQANTPSLPPSWHPPQGTPSPSLHPTDPMGIRTSTIVPTGVWVLISLCG